MNTFTQEQFDQFLSTLKFPPNPFQLKILESIAFGQGNKLVSALAGSGKTTLLVQTAQLLKQMGESSAMYLAFNVKIRDELNERLPSGFTAINSHSLGLRLCKQIHASANPRDGWKKWRDIAGSAVEYMYPTKSEQYAASRKLQSLISKVMLNNTDIDDVDEIAALDVHYGLECDPRLFEKVGACIRHAERIFRDTGVINFDEMIYWPVVMNIQPPQHKWVFVDECQDLNILQQKIALASVAEGGRMIWVGDKHQCQPPGTMVRLSDGSQKPIEQIQVDDNVVTYDRRGATFIKSGLVSETSTRHYEGNLFTVQAGGKSSRCTDSHKWLVRWTNKSDKVFVTYLMRQGTRWRIGQTRLFLNLRTDRGHNNYDFGLASRARIERADEAWILQVHESLGEALAYEAVVSARYGIPQVIFHEAYGVQHYTQEVIDSIYEQIGDISDRAFACLDAHNRNPDYPIYTRNENRQRQGRKSLFETQACNLISNYMAIIVPPDEIEFGRKERNRVMSRSNWFPITVTQEYYSGPVHSLEIHQHHKYIADGLLTCNSIYGFAGADSKAFDRVADLTNAEVLPLNICYRCPTSHLDLAREIVPEIEAGPNAIPGEIEYANPDELHKTAKPGMLLMCRLNAPLISAYFALIKNRIPAKVLGREIGKDLANTLDKVAQQDGFNYDQIVFYLERYRSQQMHMLMQKENAEQQIQNLTDKMECLIVCAQNFAECSDLECFKAELQKLFGDEDDKGTNWSTTVTLCTVHKAKGLEADLTGILKPDKMPLVWDNQAPWELEQEMNIRYVALTRAKKRMVIYGQFGETEKAAPNTTGHTSETAAEPVPVVVEEAPPAPALTEPVSSDPLQTLKNMTLFGDEDESEEATPAPEPAESKLPPIRTIPVRSTARQRLDELAESLTDDELDKIIQFFTALRDNRKEAKHAEPEPVH